MKKIFLTILICLAMVVIQATAQSYVRFIEQLQSPYGARVNITLDRQSVAVIAARTPVTMVPAFRICIFSGSDQNARAKASSAIAVLRNSYPNISSQTAYEAPVWKVFCGTYLTRTEATAAIASLKNIFPAAFIVTDKIPIEEFMYTTTNPGQQTQNIDPSQINM